MIPFLGFLPDVDEHTQGVITDCTMLLPTLRGYKGAPSVIVETPALAAACRGATYVVKLDNTTRLFAGAQTKLYEYVSSAWSDVSRVGDYTGSSDSAWRFAQFGDVTIAANKIDAMQKSVSTGAFSDLAGAPKALVVETVGGFVMVANYNDGTDTPDGIYWCAFEDYTDWTASVATQAGKLRKYDTPGEFRALKRLGQYVVAYKEGSMYLGVNNGPPTLWGFQLISGEIGTYTQEAVVSIETAHFYIGTNDIYMFDGSRPLSIGDGVREWFFTDFSVDFAYKIRGAHDKRNSLVYWYYPSVASTGNLDSCIVFNYKSRKWGRANRSIEVCLEYLTGAMTYADFQTKYPTYDVIPSVDYGSPFWNAATPNMAVFDATHVLGTLTGASLTSSLTSGAIGDDMQYTMLSRVQSRFINDPTSATMTNYYRMTDGASYTTDATIPMSAGRFDVMREARWHKVKTEYVGDVEVSGQSYVLMPGGYE
mgnify:CR=1 FL=1